ncbi:spermidine hydroxycinnamoyl transferase-like [Silene latifolia]|uniref:spermidine hydroxycinnamoyl transferase-like n=1 Tax=Silene latifolia TaxID=37657 RepID=UPI003D77C4B7
MIEEERNTIKIKSRHLVKPCEPTWNGIVPLSELDQVGIITHSSHVHFFHKPIDEEWLNPCENRVLITLKESLSRTLVSFYPLAGRLRSLSGGRFELECNAMGVELIDAESKLKITDYGDLYSSSQKYMDLLPKMDYHAHGKPIDDIPVLVVQVTRFECGGISFGMSVSHVVVDGRSAFHFTKEWARLARGEKLIKIEPCHDRRSLLADEVIAGAMDLDFEPGNCFTELYSDQVEDSVTPCDEGPGNYFSQLYSGQVEKLEWGKKVTPTFILLSKEKIERLKEVANTNEDGHGRPYSRFEIITAYMWTCVSKARDLNTEEITTLAVCVDVRGRLEPPLPSSYFGNAIVDVEATSNVGELLSRHLSYACSRVREAIEKVMGEYVSSTIEYLKNKKGLAKYQYIDDRGNIECPSSTTDDYNVDVMSWLNLSDLRIDFGWGKDFYTGPCIVNGFDGDIMLFPCDNAGSVVVSVCLLPKEKFLEYVNSPIV